MTDAAIYIADTMARLFSGYQHYDRQGQKISVERFIELSLDPAYRHLADNHIGRIGPTSLGVYRVSTIWLGYDLGMPDEGQPSYIFETCVFDHLRGQSQELRWPIEGLALYAHRQLTRICRGKWRKTKGKHLIVPVYDEDSPIRYFTRSKELK